MIRHLHPRVAGNLALVMHTHKENIVERILHTACIAPALIAVTLFASSADAVVVVDYDAADNPVTSTQPLRLADGTTSFTSGSSRAFSTNAMQPGSGYTGPAFHGGFAIATGGASMDLAQVANNSNGGDPIQFSMSNNANSSLNALVLADVTSSVFDSSSTIVLRAIRNDSQGTFSATIRLVFGVGSTYYASSTTVMTVNANNAGMSTLTLNFAQLDALTFDAYSPGTSLAYVGGSPASFDPTVDAWNSIGVLIRNANSGGSSRNNTGVELHQFTVDAIPEPASLALLGLGGLLMLGRGRRV